MPDRLAIYSIAGLIVFGICFKLFVIDSMFPNASFYTIQDPWLLSPSLIMALIITGIRYGVNATFRKKGESFAREQIELATPNWTQVESVSSSQNNEDNDKRKDNESPRKRNVANTNTNNNNTNNNNTGMNGHTDDGTIKISNEQLNQLLALARDKNKSKEKLLQKAQSLSLSRGQISDLKTYRKAVLDYESSIKKYLEVHFKLFMTVNIMLTGVYVVVLRDSAFYHPETLYTGENDKPPQKYDNFMLFYYWLSLGYHVHRCAFQFFNHARKDFWAMFIHHWATICLISLSWISGFCETGVLVMFLHDNGDVWLPLAKLFRYNGFLKLKDVTFTIFAVTWVQFRLYWFFKLAIYTVWVHGNYYYVFGHPWGFICFSLLLVLQILHLYWFILIMTIVKNLIFFGAPPEDIRSERHDERPKKSKHTQ